MLRDSADVIKEEREHLSQARAALLQDWKTGNIVRKLERLVKNHTWTYQLSYAAQDYFRKHAEYIQELTPLKLQVFCDAYAKYLDQKLFFAEQEADDACLILHAQRNIPYFIIHPQGKISLADLVTEVSTQSQSLSKKEVNLITRGLTLSLPIHRYVLPNISVIIEKDRYVLYSFDEAGGVSRDLLHKSEQVINEVQGILKMQKYALYLFKARYQV